MIKQFKGFQNFVKYNGLSEESIHIAASLITHEKIPKEKEIFRQGDKSEYFFCIIRGKVQIKKNLFEWKENEKNKIDNFNNNNKNIQTKKKDLTSIK